MSATRKRRPPVPFSSVAHLADEALTHSYRINSLLMEVWRLDRDDIADEDKRALASIMLKKNLGARLTALVGLVLKANSLLDDAPPLSADDESWLRRQIATLDGGTK
jgi:hypothetical protein